MRHPIRCALFFLVEGAYIIFAGVNHRTPTALHLPQFFSRFSTTTIRSAFGTAILAWNTLAGSFVHEILGEAFEREGPPLAAGHWGKIMHFPKSSITFKITLLASASALVLHEFGPNAIVIDNIIEKQQITAGGLLLGTSEMAHAILKVEQVLGLNLGYQTQPNWIIPKPAYNASQSGGSIHYNSDIVRFDHSCQWHAPVFGEGSEVRIGGDEYEFRKFQEPSDVAG